MADDTTEHNTGEGKLYLCAIKDVHSGAWTNDAQADLTQAQTDLAVLNNEVRAEITRDQFETVVRDMSALVADLAVASSTGTAKVHAALGLRPTYHHDSATWTPR